MSSQQELNRVFDLAIGREDAACKFYTGLCSRVKSPAVKEAFTKLAREEQGHKALLLSMKAEPGTQARFKPQADYHVAESESLPDISPDMPLRDAVALAMKKEEQAVNLYRDLAAAAAENGTRMLFENLANMELGHKVSLEALFVDIGYPEVF